jgi:hypothetical protein
MNAGSTAPDADAARDAMTSALFASLVMQQTRMALLLLGRVPDSESGKPRRDLDGARLFIDQLEMLETKTRGNLDAHEKSLLQQSLMELRLAFVEASSQPQEPATPVDAKPADAPPPASQTAAPPVSEPDSQSADTAADEGRKKFTKKY